MMTLFLNHGGPAEIHFTFLQKNTPFNSGVYLAFQSGNGRTVLVLKERGWTTGDGLSQRSMNQPRKTLNMLAT
jgi:hypothetical protein